MDIKIGDTVRYLNDIGGGKVVAILPDNKALIMDNTGFEIPVPLNQLVVVSRKKRLSKEDEEGAVIESQPKILAKSEHKDLFFFPTGNLLSGNNQPKIFLAFIPENENIGVSKSFDVVLLNDSNYTVFYIVYEIDTVENVAIFPGILGPNCRDKITIIDRKNLANISEYQIHSNFYSKGKLPIVRPWVSGIKIDHQLFERNSAFKTNVFFNQLALTYKLKDEPAEEKKVEQSLEKLLKENATEVKKKIILDTSPKEPKPVKKEPEKLREIDLHIQVLLDNTANLTPKEILDYQMGVFRKELEQAIIDNVERIVFIHGLGNGTLKTEIRKTLEREYKQYEYNDASFKEYGFGATLVTLRRK